VITVEDNDTIGVNGPINNKLLCYGMLDLARDAIKDFNDKQAASKILVAPAGSIPPSTPH
jgi:hypothetical protein